MIITSLDNKKVKEWTKLHNKKHRNEEYLIFDESQIKEALKKGYLKTLIHTGQTDIDFSNSVEVTREVINKIAKEDGLNMLGIGSPIKEKLEFGDRIMILEDLQDPLNIGRIMENASLFGYHDIILSKETADIYNPKCLNAAKKAIYNLNISHMNIEDAVALLKEKGYRIYATGLKNYSKEMYDVSSFDKMAFILGNEGSGVKESTFSLSDEIIKIDMNNIDSLNVAMAGAIMMYRFSNI